MIFNSRSDGYLKFAFDNIADYDLIEQKLKLIREYSKARCSFYVLCAFDRAGKYDMDFWINDIRDVFLRARLLIKYNAFPYLMRFKEYENSPFRGMYINMAAWMNQPNMYKKMSYRKFVEKRGNAAWRYLEYFCQNAPNFDMSLLDERR